MGLTFVTAIINGYIVVGIIGVIVNFTLATYLVRRMKKRFDVVNWTIFNPSLFLLYILIVVIFVKYLLSIGAIA